MLLRDLIKQGIQTISEAYPEKEAKEMVLAYLSDAIGVQRHTHIIEPGYLVGEEDTAEALKAFVRMAAQEPLQYVTGKACFYGRVFKVNPSVLIPRPETELLCREAVTRFKGGKVLDLCTGSGCIAWTIALECPEAQVTAVDISDEALSFASTQDFTEEIARTGAVRPRFAKADILDSMQVEDFLPEGPYDMILSNPPYVKDSEKTLMRPNVLNHEPHLALFVPDDDALRFYKSVADWATRLLAEDGVGIVEINESLGKETAEVFTDAGFSRTEIIRDLSDKERFVVFQK